MYRSTYQKYVDDEKSNSNHFMVKVPELVIRIILTYAHSNVDKICFLMTCKAMFHRCKDFLPFNLSIIGSEKQDMDYLGRVTRIKRLFKIKSFSKSITQSLTRVYAVTDDIKEIPDLTKDYYNCTQMVYIGTNHPIGTISSSDSSHIITPLSLFELSIRCNTQPVKYIPSTITKLILDNKFNMELPAGILPNYLESISFGDAWDHPIQGLFTNTLDLKSIKFGKMFSQPITPGTFPKNGKLAKLTLGVKFNHVLTEESLPNTITDLVLSNAYNHSFGPNGEAIPNSVKNLTFGVKYNQPINLSTKPNIKYLHLGRDYNIILDGKSLPPNLTTLIFSLKYNHPFKSKYYLQQKKLPAFDVFPTSLRTIKFGNGFNEVLHPNVIPMGCENVTMGKAFDQQFEQYTFPPTISELTFKGNVPSLNDANCFPPLMTNLSFTCKHGFFSLSQGPALRRLTHLQVSMIFNLDTSVLPLTLVSLDATTLSFSGKVFPNISHLVKLNTLKFGTDTKMDFQMNSNALPISLEKLLIVKNCPKIKLSIGESNVKEIFINELASFSKIVLPENLEVLTLGERIEKSVFTEKTIFNFEVKPLIPTKNLKRITFGKFYNKHFDFACFPQLTHATFGDRFRQKLDMQTMSKTMQEILVYKDTASPTLDNSQNVIVNNQLCFKLVPNESIITPLIQFSEFESLFSNCELVTVNNQIQFIFRRLSPTSFILLNSDDPIGGIINLKYRYKWENILNIFHL